MKVLAGRKGRITLVGAGPGDPDLITVKGLRALQRADVVVYDRLVNPELLESAPSGAERIYVGKRGGHYTFPQAKINALMVERARRGAHVVRLKGGDPFLYGRGGEEVLYARKHAVPCLVVPGVSAALAAPASAGIPVTHRGVSSTVAILSGHQATDAPNPVNWNGISRAAETVIVMMPLVNLRHVVGHLVSEGRPLGTPAAVIQAGTCPEQKAVVSTLKELVADVDRAGLTSPATLVVGEVVALASRIQGLEELDELEATEELARLGAV